MPKWHWYQIWPVFFFTHSELRSVIVNQFFVPKFFIYWFYHFVLMKHHVLSCSFQFFSASSQILLLYSFWQQFSFSAAKLALVGLSNTLAQEGKSKNIHCNTIVPIAGSRMTQGILPPGKAICKIFLEFLEELWQGFYL